MGTPDRYGYCMQPILSAEKRLCAMFRLHLQPSTGGGILSADFHQYGGIRPPMRPRCVNRIYERQH